MSPPVTIVMVTYNSTGVAGNALAAAARSRECGLAECIVVDNASRDGTPDFVRRGFPQATVVESGGNLGYGRGCNLGLQRAASRYVLFQNPDAVLEPDALEKLVRFLDDHPRAALVAPAILDGDGGVQHASRLPTPGSVIAMAVGRGAAAKRRPIQPGGEPFRTDWLCGALLMGRRDVLNEIGGFDPRFFLYFEETDLCKRVAARGHELWAVGGAIAHHAVHASARSTGRKLVDGCIAEHYFQSRFYYLVKHHGWLAAVTAETVELSLCAARLAWYGIRGRSIAAIMDRFRSPKLSMPAKPR